MTNEVFELMRCFPDAIIKHGELILDKKATMSFCVENVEDKETLISKLLEWCSRTPYKFSWYAKERTNEDYRRSTLTGLNNYLGTNWGEEEIFFVYCELGNAIKHKLTLDFIRSGYDIEILRSSAK